MQFTVQFCLGEDAEASVAYEIQRSGEQDCSQTMLRSAKRTAKLFLSSINFKRTLPQLNINPGHSYKDMLRHKSWKLAIKSGSGLFHSVFREEYNAVIDSGTLCTHLSDTLVYFVPKV